MPRPTVVVVDDDSALLTAVNGLMQLHMPEVRVQAFESPHQALAHLEKKEVATVVTDLNMNELDGFSLLRKAKVIRPNVPVILFSGHIDSSLASEAINMGAHDVLQKPFNREAFLTVLTLALNTYELAREVRTRRLITERLSKRVDHLKRVIADPHQRPTMNKGIEGTIRASRELYRNSLSSLESSLDQLCQHADMAEARLHVARQRLIVKQQEAREGFLKRIVSKST
ncbi:MAG TPA: response regulator [Nitrospiraceae bacterium]|nr:response regulator [Nitrospiraceae bacterium]